MSGKKMEQSSPKRTIKELGNLSFQSLTLSGIDWKTIVKNDPALTKEYYNYIQLRSNWIMVNL